MSVSRKIVGFFLGLSKKRRSAQPHINPLMDTLEQASALIQKGNLLEAEGLCKKVLESNSKHAQALHLSGVIQQKIGNSTGALALIRESIRLDPSNPYAQCNLGVTYRSLGNLSEAANAFRRAITLGLATPGLLNNLGSVLIDDGMLNDAEMCFRKAMALEQNNPVTYNNLSCVLLKRMELDEAEALLRKAELLDPNSAQTLANLGDLERVRGNLAKAETYYETALQHDPGMSHAYLNLGTIYHSRRIPDRAEMYYRKARALGNSPSSTWNLSLMLLLQNKLEEGFSLYEHRFACTEEGLPGHTGLHLRFGNVPRWKGEALNGNPRLLLWTEQGFGDNLMMIRYVPLLRSKGIGTLIIYCEPPLERLFMELPAVRQTITKTKMPPFGDFDLHCPIMSLPHIFDTRPDSIPSHVPYLIVPDHLTANWAKRFTDTSQRKVGLVWSGNSSSPADANRSIPLRDFEPLLKMERIQLISLQKGIASTQLLESGWPILNFMEECHDFMDTAALVANLDLVISVDTAVAHLAGALGKPVWLLNRFESEWRWGLGRENSPWYPSMQIFNQEVPGEWKAVIQRIGENLTQRV